MSFNFVFFYIDTETNELSNKHKSLERKDIIYFIKSIKKHHPESRIIFAFANLAETESKASFV